MFNIAVDFDGVLNTYTGWNGEYDLYEPREGVEDFLKKLSCDFNVIVFTTRDSSSVARWLDEYGLGEYVSEVTNVKPRALCYVDDRSVNFNGDYAEVIEIVSSFKTHWE